jgi:sulfite dehydrogenase
MPSTEIVAVNQCSGNRRGLVQPHVPGVQWGPGAMGCARWRGVRLKDLLEKIGAKPEAVEVAFDGADRPLSEKTPDFIKSLPLAKAMEETTIIAYEMNGEPLPRYNGFPARLVVPGWTATYWVKHLSSIKILMKPENSFWMKTAYRIPQGAFPTTSRFSSQDTASNTPITEIMVNSLVASHADGDEISSGDRATISGVAWDGGRGINSVQVSCDHGRGWQEATLGEDLGRYSFRTFSYELPRRRRGDLTVMVRAINMIGQTQPQTLIQNPAGYHHNVVQTLRLRVG